MLVDSNDGSGGDTGIDVGGPIQRIENSNVLIGFGEDGILVGVDKVELLKEVGVVSKKVRKTERIDRARHRIFRRFLQSNGQ